MSANAKPVRARRSQERAEITKKKLVDVAIKLFSERGFDGVSLREIEIQADVQRNLLQYHFGNKDDIWKAAVNSMVSDYSAFTRQRLELIKDMSSQERVAYTIRSYVRFCALYPEFNRLMVQEGKQKSWRVEWLVENLISPSLQILREMAKEDLNISDEEFVHWYYMFAGGGALIFSMAPEADLLFNLDVDKEEVIERHAKMMVDFLLSRSRK